MERFLLWISSIVYVLYVFLSHDVHWSRLGPGVDHVLARRDLFTPEVIDRVLREGFNPYFNVPDIIDIEERYGVKSTFFFRPLYDDYVSAWCYEDVIRDLVAGGWEVAVCLNSASSLERVIREKRMIERISRVEVVGCRVYNLSIGIDDYWRLRLAGLRYDSSIKMIKDFIDASDMGFRWISDVLVFPVTIMDFNLFMHMGVSESDVFDVMMRAVNDALRLDKRVITILWHSCSLKMIGGRMYDKILEALIAMDRVKVVRGMDLLKAINARQLQRK